MNIDSDKKNYYLNESKSFCMFPWVHMHVTPLGVGLPCCIANQQIIAGNINNDSLLELVNSDNMKDLRRDMLDDVKNDMCKACHRHEEQGITSFRQTNNIEYGKYFDEVLNYTDCTGELAIFKMRYFDIRLSNICNMKCRTCNSHYSSMWESEDRSQGHKIIGIEKTARIDYVKQILPHIQYMDMAYFAGGEPFISEEHYIMLEEMINQNRNDIRLRYNTNLSTLKYKDKDLLNLWKHFNNGVEIYASLDHYGERAEYIRHGTDWGQIENNFNMLLKNPTVSMQINSVLSIFNFVTFGDFYNYIIDNNWISTKSNTYTVYNMISPIHITALALPILQKKIGIENISNVVDRMKTLGYTNQLTQLTDSINWVKSSDTWEEHKTLFRSEVGRLDKVRNENFVDVFPELAGLIDD
jgi:organic radical activating enzyme